MGDSLVIRQESARFDRVEILTEFLYGEGEEEGVRGSRGQENRA